MRYFSVFGIIIAVYAVYKAFCHVFYATISRQPSPPSAARDSSTPMPQHVAARVASVTA